MNIDPEYHYEALNVETQQNNSHSLLWWMKRMIAQRKQHPAFGRGKMEILFPANRKILAFVREFEDEKILVVANLSRFTQCVELDLSRHRDAVPVEVFGRNRFPAITEQPYLLSLGPARISMVPSATSRTEPGIVRGDCPGGRYTGARR